MKLSKRQLKRIIREEYTRLQRRGLINEMGFRDMRGEHGRQMSHQDMEDSNYDKCVEKCLAVIPPTIKQMCSMGHDTMFVNDIYHLCEPICEHMGCNCDDVSEDVRMALCGR